MQSNVERDGKLLAGEPSGGTAHAKTTVPPPGISGSRGQKQKTRRRRFFAWLQTIFLSPGILPAPWSAPIFGYLCAVLGQVMASVFLNLLLTTFPNFHFFSTLLLLIILLVALGWGAGPSLAGTLLGAIFLVISMSPMTFSLSLARVEDSVGVLFYIIVGFAISLLTSQTQRERRAAQALSQRLETSLEAITDGLFVYDADGQIRRMNTAARTLLARCSAPEDFLISAQARAERYAPRSHDGETMASEQVPIVRMLRGEVLTDARAMDVLVRTLKGEDLWLNVSGSPLYDEAGQITGAIAITRDVTERRQLEQRTRAAFDVLLQMAQVLVQDSDALISPEAGVHSRSRTIMQQLALLTQQVLGCHRLGITGIEPETELLYPLAVVGLSPEQEQQWWQEQERQTIRLSESPDPEALARFRACEIFLMDMTQPPYSAQPNPYGIRQMLVAPIGLSTRLLGFFTLDYGGLDHIYTPDEIELTRAVTRFAALVMEWERLLAETARARANALAASETARQMDAFLSMASHELKTPLTVLLGNLQLARRRLANQPQAQEAARRGFAELQLLLERAERQVNVQNRLVSDLIDLSRLQTEKLELQKEKVDLIPLVRQVIEDQRLAAGEQRIQIEEFSTQEDIFITADAVRIGQVLGNYLSNALKYSPAERTVTVRVKVENGNARVEVADQGPGLSPQQRARIWERFYQVPEIVVQSGSGVGLGLGLHISSFLIQQHGGQVGVESAPGHGSTFWFTLPLCDTPKC